MKPAIQAYLDHLRVLARRTNTIENRRRILGQQAEWLEQRRIFHPKHVRLSHLERYQRYLVRRYHPNSVGERTRMMKHFYAWLEKQGRLPANPALGLGVVKSIHALPPAPPDARTIYGLIDTHPDRSPLDLRNRAMLEVLFSTGMRRTEFLFLELCDVRLSDRTILVRNGKGNKDRVVLLSARAHKALARYLEEARPLLAQGLSGHLGWQAHAKRNGRPADKALWLAAHSGTLGYLSFANLFRRWQERLGKPFHPHLVRHAFAVHLLRQGVDIRHVQVLLGHDKIDTTKIYLRLVKEDYKKAYDRSFPVIRLPCNL